MADLTLLENGNTNGTAVNWRGGFGTVAVSGTFDGATFSIDMRLNATQGWVTVGTESNLTAAGAFNIVLPPCQIRGNIASAGGSTSLTALARED